MWVPPSTRERFVIVKAGEEGRHFLGGDRGVAADTLPRELGGTGPSLQGDCFLEAAVARYDATATLPPACQD